MFEAIVGQGFHGDIAIDDVGVSNTACRSLVSCDFEQSFCGWVQSKTDKFDWMLRHGSTPSRMTGPSVDHTLHTSSGN